MTNPIAVKNIFTIFAMLFWMTNTLQSQSSTLVETDLEVVKIDSLMQASFKNGIFNGVLLVSKNGKPIYKNAFGYADKESNLKLNKGSVFYLASVSKQFTAMAIMMLKEQGKLSYDDKLSMYFDGLLDYGNTVTIKHILTHTSGIPDHFGLGIYKKGLTNKDVLEVLLKQKKLDFKPGKKYSYSNGGYVLLSLIVEKVSGLPFHEFMKINIFEPINMKSSLVYNNSTSLIENRAVGYNKFGELDDYEIFTTGAGGIFSTIDDLHLWDQALYTEKLITKSTLEEAFTRATLNNGKLINYGFGWMVSEKDDRKSVYHAGGLSGYRTFIIRNLYNNSSFILLTNHGDASNIQEIVNGLNGILKEN